MTGIGVGFWRPCKEYAEVLNKLLSKAGVKFCVSCDAISELPDTIPAGVQIDNVFQ